MFVGADVRELFSGFLAGVYVNGKPPEILVALWPAAGPRWGAAVAEGWFEPADNFTDRLSGGPDSYPLAPALPPLKNPPGYPPNRF